VTRRIVLAIVAAAIVIAAYPSARPALERAWFVYTLWTEPPPAHLPSPIAHVSARAIANSWGAPRSGGAADIRASTFSRRRTRPC